MDGEVAFGFLIIKWFGLEGTFKGQLVQGHTQNAKNNTQVFWFGCSKTVYLFVVFSSWKLKNEWELFAMYSFQT